MLMELRSQKGFTLVELLIVIAIIAVLAMVAVPRFMNMQQRSIIDSCRANQGTLETALEQYASVSAGTYPGTGLQGDLVTNGILKRAVECPGEATRGDGDDYAWTTAAVVTCDEFPGLVSAGGHNII